ncbi:MAG: Nif11-like leader peptide family natural product precursor [Desulfotomaculaceae bacterium]|nr:Nif11-like leader peptide family natural product precursor [Desulfotomaculaceae bacterium]
MSEKEAYDFMKRCRDDKLLGEEIKNLLASGEREAALVRIAAREGFNITIEEIKTIAEKAHRETVPRSSELDEETLSQVSGGSGSSCGPDCTSGWWCYACPTGLLAGLFNK